MSSGFPGPQPITTGGVTYREQPWHKECFVCAACGKLLSGQRFTSRDDSAYCLNCFCDLHAKKCAGCTHPISGESQGPLSLCMWWVEEVQGVPEEIYAGLQASDRTHFPTSSLPHKCEINFLPAVWLMGSPLSSCVFRPPGPQLNSCFHSLSQAISPPSYARPFIAQSKIILVTSLTSYKTCK